MEFLKELVSTHLLEQLAILRDLIFVINKAVQDLSKRIEADAPKVLPKGMGRLTHENIETEVRDWNRFLNRRAIASYSGLTGGVSSSGESRSDLSITKAGNRRLRTDYRLCPTTFGGSLALENRAANARTVWLDNDRSVKDSPSNSLN